LVKAWAPPPQGLQGLQGLQAPQARFPPQGLQPRLAPHGLHPFAAQGLHPFAAHGLQPRFAPQGLQPRFAAQGLHAFFPAQGLQPRLPAQGLQPRRGAQGLQAAYAMLARPAPATPIPMTTAAGSTVEPSILPLNLIMKPSIQLIAAPSSGADQFVLVTTNLSPPRGNGCHM